MKTCILLFPPSLSSTYLEPLFADNFQSFQVKKFFGVNIESIQSSNLLMGYFSCLRNLPLLSCSGLEDYVPGKARRTSGPQAAPYTPRLLQRSQLPPGSAVDRGMISSMHLRQCAGVPCRCPAVHSRSLRGSVASPSPSHIQSDGSLGTYSLPSP